MKNLGIFSLKYFFLTLTFLKNINKVLIAILVCLNGNWLRKNIKKTLEPSRFAKKSSS